MLASFSIVRFEALAAAGNFEPAARDLLALLEHLQAHYGQLPPCEECVPGASPREVLRAAERIAAAVSTLVSNPGFNLGERAFYDFVSLQRWLAALYGAAPQGNADAVLRRFDRGSEGARFVLSAQELRKFCLLHLPDSAVALDPADLWRADRRLAAAAGLALLSCSTLLTESAHSRREQLLSWLPPRLGELSLDELPTPLVHAAWMQCSYGESPYKHELKTALNGLLRGKLMAEGCGDLPAGVLPQRERPVLLCVLEWFFSRHVMHRGYARAIEALRRRFRLVAVSLREATDEESRRLFDEVHLVPRAQHWLEGVRQVRSLAAALRPDLVYYPSVGMLIESCFLANLRLAPVQVMSLGHPASTRSACMDYVIADGDLLAAECFSEALAPVPAGSMPSMPPPEAPPPTQRKPASSEPVRVAVTASPMKLNPTFLHLLRQIAATSPVPLEYHFFVAGAFGLVHAHVDRLIRGQLPAASRVLPHLGYEAYAACLSECDMFLDPFPFGNSSSVIDTVRQRLPGVCLTGAEPAARADGLLFARLGFPPWCVARTPSEYAAAALRLASNPGERAAVIGLLQQNDPVAALTIGDSTPFAEAMTALCRGNRVAA